MNEELFSKSVRFRDDLKRNIVRVPTPSAMYQALLDDSCFVEIPQKATSLARQFMSGENSSDDFYYTTAIEYPFIKEPYLSSRYADGRYPIWYGCVSIETTIYETVYHAKKFITAIEHIEDEQEIIRERSLYDVFCDTIFLDLVSQKKYRQQLTTDDYHFTQDIAKETISCGFSGILSPSARQPDGINGNIFKKEVLSNPRFIKHIQYRYSIGSGIMNVYDSGKLILVI